MLSAVSHCVVSAMQHSYCCLFKRVRYPPFAAWIENHNIPNTVCWVNCSGIMSRSYLAVLWCAHRVSLHCLSRSSSPCKLQRMTAQHRASASNHAVDQKRRNVSQHDTVRAACQVVASSGNRHGSTAVDLLLSSRSGGNLQVEPATPLRQPEQRLIVENGIGNDWGTCAAVHLWPVSRHQADGQPSWPWWDFQDCVCRNMLRWLVLLDPNSRCMRDLHLTPLKQP
jgi:hypothetical protein